MMHAELFGIVYHDDTVTHDDTHQRDNAQYAGNTHLLSHDEYARGSTQQREQ